LIFFMFCVVNLNFFSWIYSYRFDGLKMLHMLRGKRVVFVGDSLNRNMWQSLVCALRASLKDKSRIYEVSGRREFRIQGFFSFKFKVSSKECASCFL
jgi:hypothetical protein